jgi:tetraacyldisaccharide 4'-kinase
VFSSQDYRQIERAYDTLQSDKPRIIITTEKDYVRLNKEQMPMWSSIYALPIEVKVMNDQQELFNNQILSFLDHVRKDSRNSNIPEREND